MYDSIPHSLERWSRYLERTGQQVSEATERSCQASLSLLSLLVRLTSKHDADQKAFSLTSFSAIKYLNLVQSSDKMLTVEQDLQNEL